MFVFISEVFLTNKALFSVHELRNTLPRSVIGNDTFFLDLPFYLALHQHLIGSSWPDPA